MKKILLSLSLLALLSCDALTTITAPPAAQPVRQAERIFQLDNQPEFGLGNFMSGFNFELGTMTDSTDIVQMIVSPIKNTDGDVLAPMIYDSGLGKDYKLVIRFGASYHEANYFYENYLFLQPQYATPQKFKHSTDRLNTAQFHFEAIEEDHIDVQTNDLWLYDSRILILILSQSTREDGYVNVHFRYKVL